MTATDTTAFPILVLSLEGDDARRKPLLDRLSALGLKYELFFGVDGRKGLSSADAAQIDRDRAHKRLGRTLGDGEFACALSHQRIYDAIVARGLPGAVVLEDDATIGAPFARFIAARTYQAADLLMLDHRGARVWADSARALSTGVTGWRLALPALLTTGYSISRKGAAFMIAQSRPVAGTADWPCDITELGALALEPRLVDHPADAEGSHLMHERTRRFKPLRFFEAGYWRRWWRKRVSKRIS